jgi:23S rRNA (uracil1939-C5)-methyltransferase
VVRCLAVAQRWTIEKLVPGGEGFLRLDDGRAAFAPGTVPGDQILVHRDEERRGYVRATQWELVSAGPDRVDPPCPIASTCGGCDLMHLARPAQLAAKRAMLIESLERIAKISTAPVAADLVTAGPSLGYRSRARFHVDALGEIGFRARGSHDVVGVPHCPVCSEPVNTALDWIRQAPAAIRRELREVDVREDLGGGSVLVRLTPRERPSTRLRQWAAAIRDSCSVQLVGVTPAIRRRFPLPGGLHLVVNDSSFTQVNWWVNLALIEHLLTGVRERDLHDFCELYCGCGNFTLPLLSAGLRGLAVERDAAAIDAARVGAREAGLPTATFEAGDVSQFVEQLVRRTERFDLVVIDPPRDGAKQITGQLGKLCTNTLVICSCDPTTLARDTKQLQIAGFTLQQVIGFDMFPQTHHLETVAWFHR